MGAIIARNIKRVLIYRLGSLGDTIVALPSLHLIARAFPEAEKRVITNLPVSCKASPISIILNNSGLVQGYYFYSPRLRNLVEMLNLRHQIRGWRPEVLVYLAESRGGFKALRDAAFFKFLGIKNLIGVPYSKDLQENRYLGAEKGYEHEAARLARCLRPLGEVALDDRKVWDLGLITAEKARAEAALKDWPGKDRFIACSVGTKIDVNDWGEDNWAGVCKIFSKKHESYGLLLIGAADEFSLSEKLARAWSGPKLNLCGRLSPRETAWALKQAEMFVGHDSGPIHLAASVGLRCVGIFSARNKPGVWFPYGHHHKIIYHQTDCYGCNLEVCEKFQKKCIAGITINEVLDSLEQIICESKDGR